MAAFGLWNLHFEIPAYSLNDFRRGLEATKNEKSSQGIGRGRPGTRQPSQAMENRCGSVFARRTHSFRLQPG